MTRSAWARRPCNFLAPLRPFAGPPTESDLVAYFEAVSRETELPITLYLNPGPGADVSIPATIALAQLPRVELIKESSRDLARVSRLIVEIDRAGHARYFTTMQMLLATIQLGGSGATMPPPACEIARHVIDAFLAGDHARAAALQLQFAPGQHAEIGCDTGGPAPAMKAAMNLIGVPVGEPYPPLCLAQSRRAPRHGRAAEDDGARPPLLVDSGGVGGGGGGGGGGGIRPPTTPGQRRMRTVGPYSGFRFADLTTLPHFSVSAARSLPKSAADIA